MFEDKFSRSIAVGRISYMNVAPVYFGLDNGLKPSRLEMVNGPPSVLNQMMASGDLDISPVSSAAYARHQDEWLVLPDLSIACFGKVMSVILVSRHPFDALDNKKVILTDESATAADLLRLLFASKKIRPVFEIGTIKTPADFHEKAAAALVIGDAALASDWDRCVDQVWDLGDMWRSLMDLPFVFALWAVRKSFAEKRPEVVSSVIDCFAVSKNQGKLNIDKIAASASQRLGLDIEICRRYYDILSYDLDAFRIKGLEAFFEGLYREKIITKRVCLSFFEHQEKTCAA
jgi:chorismate dehydratase